MTYPDSPAKVSLIRRWPEIVAVQYKGEPELIAANSDEDSARHFLSTIDAPEFANRIAAPDSLNTCPLCAYLLQAVEALCGMDLAAALRLLRAASAEIKGNSR